jgi:DNA-binding winged helix-turn-helix (wHTH) protein/TolB-like protein/Flp pilus assembly protein TadD
MSEKTGHLYEFGPFVLDTAQQLLTREGAPVQLTPKTYDTLLVLVESHGRLMLKDEIMKAVWPDSFVEESNLTQQISMIRRALGETAGERRYIATVAGRGYRFAAPVTEAVRAPIRRVFKPVWALAPALVIMVLAFGIYRWRPVPERVRSLAILPFQSLREDPKSDFLGFSLADAVITKLGYVRSLSVRPSSAIGGYKHMAIDIPKVAAELQVDTILTGNFLLDGNDLRITSQLVDVKTRNILWRGSFDLEYDKLLTVQDSVARQIIKGLELSLSPSEVERLKPDKQIDPQAYEYYLRGVDLYANNDFPLAIKMLQKAIEMAPDYAPAWAGLGRAHSANASFEFGGGDAYREAQAAYEKALALQPTQIEAKIYMANLFTDTGRVEQALPLLRRALQTNPNHAEAHWELGYAYRFAGMLKESAAECERARQLDPSVKLSSSALNTYLYLGEYDKFLESLPRNSENALIVFYRGFGDYYKKNLDRAVKDFDRAFELRPTMLQAKLGKVFSEAIGKRNKKALEMLNETNSKIEERDVRDSEAIYKIAQAYAVLGEKASALRVLRRSIESGFFSYPYIAADPLLESVRDEPEFARLLTMAKERHEAFKRL